MHKHKVCYPPQMLQMGKETGGRADEPKDKAKGEIPEKQIRGMGTYL